MQKYMSTFSSDTGMPSDNRTQHSVQKESISMLAVAIFERSCVAAETFRGAEASMAPGGPSESTTRH